MKKEKRRNRFILSLLFSVVVFCVILVAVLVAGAALYLLDWFNVLSGGVWVENSLVETMLLMVLISAVVGFLVALAAGRIPLAPINRIIDQVNQLASGNFKARLEFGSLLRDNPSFAELSDSFNTMARELENTALLRMDFINNFSHEFKTPIVSIAGFAKLLKKGNLTPAQQREYLDVIEAESLRLSQMATNVLNLTRVESQSMLTQTETYNLSEQLRTCILLFIDQLEQKELEIQAEFGEYTITADEELMKQVWINLISNAVKFSPEYGTIGFHVKEGANTLTVEVRNQSDTLSPEVQKRIFDKFYQADESHAAEGNGIGLAIVRQVVELHHGLVSIRSENGLTTFTVVLPKKA